MVSSRILPSRQREAIKEYLEERPIRTPGIIRGIRSRLLRGEIDLDQMLKDIVLLRDLMNLDLPTGRPTNAERDMKAFGYIRTDAEEAGFKSEEKTREKPLIKEDRLHLVETEHE